MRYYIYNNDTLDHMYFDGEGAKTREQLRRKFGYFLTVDHKVPASVDGPARTASHIYTVEDVFAEPDGLDTAELWLTLTATVCLATHIVLSFFAVALLLSYWDWHITGTLLLAGALGVPTNLAWIEWALERPGKRAEAFDASTIKDSKLPIAHPDDIPDFAIDELRSFAPVIGAALASSLGALFGGLLYHRPNGVSPDSTTATDPLTIRSIVRSDGVVPPRICPAAVSHVCSSEDTEVCNHSMPHTEIPECSTPTQACPACVPHLEPRSPQLLRCRYGAIQPDGFFSNLCSILRRVCEHAPPHPETAGEHGCQATRRKASDNPPSYCNCPGCQPLHESMGNDPAIRPPEVPAVSPVPSPTPVPAPSTGRKIIIKDKKPEEVP